jgi:hypothetical protein
VGLYYPIKSLWVGEVAERTREVEPVLASLSTSLLERQIDFDYLDDDAICRGTVEKGGVLAVGDCRYRAIVFPLVSIVPIETLRQLRTFAEAGGSVVFLYGEPHLTCRAASQSELPEILKAMETFTVSDGSDVDVVLGTLPWSVKLGIANHEIRVLRRTTGDTELFFLTNQSIAQEHALRVRLPVEGPVTVFDPETGAASKAVVTAGTVRLTLPRNGSVFLLVGPGGAETPSGVPTAAPTRTVKIEGPWMLWVTRQWVYRGGEIVLLEVGEDEPPTDMERALAMWSAGSDKAFAQGEGPEGSHLRIRELAHWDTVFAPTFCGTVDYLVVFELEGKPGRAVLDLGEVGVVAKVILNDKTVGKRLWPPYRFDVTDAVADGLNVTRVLVTSTIHRLMSDETVVSDLKGRGWYNGYAQQVAKFEGAPAPAGLIGPVKLDLWQ